LKDKRLAEWALRLNMKYGKMRGNKREVTIGTAHTDTVNSLNETINQSINLVGRAKMVKITANSGGERT
jgi:hypothetical protein